MRGFLVLGLTLLAAGCGPSFPETYPVTGTVTLNGEPVEGADVVLVPSDESSRSAGGYTDAQGNFSVRTYFDPRNQLDGAMPGEYTVTVSKLEKRETPADLKPEEVMAYHMKLGPPKSLLPEKYSVPKTSGFKVSVDADSATEPLKLDLKGPAS